MKSATSVLGGTGMLGTFITDDEFEDHKPYSLTPDQFATIYTEGGFDDLFKLLDEDVVDLRLVDDHCGEEVVFQVLDKVIMLAANVDQLIILRNLGLWDDDLSDKARDELMWERMLDLAVTHGDLDTIFYQLSMEEKEIHRRNYIRKLFDKADELGYPTEIDD